ncbi:MAG: Holliday junction resolvase RuvX [Phycisphaerae bacterium]
MTRRVMGIDYGRRRIGTAIADLEIRIALPLKTVAGRDDAARDARSVADLADTEDVGRFVVGLPLNMDGSDSDQTRLTRRFADELARLSGKPVELQDERLSSYAASELLDAAGVRKRRRKGLIDQIAAQQILAAWLDRGPPEE